MQKERPLSPHMSIYKPQLTSMLSILHRATGVFLTLGTPLLVFWLWSVAAGPQAYASMQACLNHWIAQLALLGWSFAFFYHLCNGIRHLFWDVGRGFELTTLNKSGWFVLFASIALTAVTWYLAYSQLSSQLSSQLGGAA
jgi:succinate dehydrogenase / fumarate reductase cytochrome b subunit